ncbi:hypothetical protein NQ317_019412 [Molorchus minor]|uniref:DUF4485 domain-containing protein n=1 Tax=Molorchus minor TaxID=1323400 RepID=A0ABQ9JJZ8_9CUCU|nr:hypothetical protein NQ317_019412 [Molorchus minor]
MTGLDVLDENFFYNSLLAKALVHLIPPNERKILRLWFDKLLTLGKTQVQKEIRNDFMWFILLMLQCKKIREPFNSIPPADVPPPSATSSDPIKCTKRFWWQMTTIQRGWKVRIRRKTQFKQSAPSSFFLQPTCTKRRGYMLLFSI